MVCLWHLQKKKRNRLDVGEECRVCNGRNHKTKDCQKKKAESGYAPAQPEIKKVGDNFFIGQFFFNRTASKVSVRPFSLH